MKLISEEAMYHIKISINANCPLSPALVIAADTGLWLRPVQYKRLARAAGNAPMIS
ncbi:MAG: hypothetical protein JWQ66_3746 [Mucilaginibacter sp.]|nr:hypothetical protein [Mucilaginibacter sp.]